MKSLSDYILIHLKILNIVLLLFLASTTITGQSESSDVKKQLWLDYNPEFKINDGLKMLTPVGLRTIFPNEWYRIYISPQIVYNWPRLMMKSLRFKEQIKGGIGFYYTDNINSVNRLEIRPFQGYSLWAPNREHFSIKHNLMIEERFELDTKDWANTFGLRLRYSASITLRFKGDFWEYGKGSYIPIGAELFWNLMGTKQFNDNIRFTIGLGRQFSDEWKAAFFLGYFYSHIAEGEKFQNNNIMFRLRIYHKI